MFNPLGCGSRQNVGFKKSVSWLLAVVLCLTTGFSLPGMAFAEESGKFDPTESQSIALAVPVLGEPAATSEVKTDADSGADSGVDFGTDAGQASSILNQLSKNPANDGLESLAVITSGPLLSWDRLYGENRYQTMQKIVSTKQAGATSDTVIVATGEDFPDALAASGLAGAYNAAIVLTPKNALNDAARATLNSLKPKNIVVLGSAKSVSTAIYNELSALVADGSHITRYAGNNRHQTAVQIFLGAGSSIWGDTAVIATGGNFADALSIAPYAYVKKAPVFLADSSSKRLDANTVAAIKNSSSIKKVIITGSTKSVSDAVKTQLGSGYSYQRLEGTDRYLTSQAIARYAVSQGVLKYQHAIVTTGQNFPDALAGGALGGKNNSVMLLMDDNTSGRSAYLNLILPNSLQFSHGYLLGSSSTTSNSLLSLLKSPGVATANEQEVLRLVNIERAKVGAAALSFSQSMQVAAEIRGYELLQLFSHTRPDGTNCFTVFTQIKLSYSYAGENIAVGYRTPAEVVDGWMNSAGHKANILNKNYTYMGIAGLVFSNSQYGTYWAQMFTRS